MLTAKDIQIGQSISASFWFRYGRYGNSTDYASITGTVIKKLECYNEVLVDVNLKESFNSPRKTVWVDLSKSEFSINN